MNASKKLGMLLQLELRPSFPTVHWPALTAQYKETASTYIFVAGTHDLILQYMK